MGLLPVAGEGAPATRPAAYPWAVTMVMAVWFSRYGRLHYLDPGDLTPRVGDKVLVPTDDGPEVAECVWPPQYVADDVEGLPDCPGLATPADLVRDEANRAVRTRARVVARRLIRQHDLPMKVVGVDYLDRLADVDRLVRIWFSAPGRVDFRTLVRDLARSLHARIDLRQVGPRDAARIVEGVGSCGRELCCSTFLKEFEPVSVRMARDQHLPANPMRISGACGRLMCCLKYEHPLYVEAAAQVRGGGSCDRTDSCASRAAHDEGQCSDAAATTPAAEQTRPATPTTPTTPTPSLPTAEQPTGGVPRT